MGLASGAGVAAESDTHRTPAACERFTRSTASRWSADGPASGTARIKAPATLLHRVAGARGRRTNARLIQKRRFRSLRARFQGCAMRVRRHPPIHDARDRKHEQNRNAGDALHGRSTVKLARESLAAAVVFAPASYEANCAPGRAASTRGTAAASFHVPDQLPATRALGQAGRRRVIG